MPNYSFREGEQETAFQVWPSDVQQSILLHPHCATNEWEREFPLYDDDFEEYGVAPELPICERCNGEILVRRRR